MSNFSQFAVEHNFYPRWHYCGSDWFSFDQNSIRDSASRSSDQIFALRCGASSFVGSWFWPIQVTYLYCSLINGYSLVFMPDDRMNLRLLEKAFSESDFDYLKNHGAFQYQLQKDDGTDESFRGLIDLGELLLQQKRELRDKQ